jgi:hypothetical protein
MREIFVGQGYRTSKAQWIDHWEIFRRSLISIAFQNLVWGLEIAAGLAADPAAKFSTAHASQKMFSPDFY